MQTAGLDYELGAENIATEPREIRLGRRDLSRLLVVDRRTGALEHSAVRNLVAHLRPGDLLVLNDSRFVPGVLRTRAENSAQIEMRVARLTGERSCLARLYPSHFVEPGRLLKTASGSTLRISETGIPPHGLNRVEADEPFYGLLSREGTPITSFFYGGEWSSEAYRPVYAAKEGGACESPLAGLHFTTDLLASIQEAGINVAFITLHVAGSWLPLREDQRPDDAEPEAYEISEETAALIASTRARGNRVVAVGSTSVRCLESAARDGSLQAGAGVSRMYITPGHHFQIVDAYFTNFHPARSSLMVLDAAFCRKDLLLHAYGVARSNSYLFFEFGDAVLYL